VRARISDEAEALADGLLDGFSRARLLGKLELPAPTRLLTDKEGSPTHAIVRKRHSKRIKTRSD
jgi:hypothetical protein